MHPLPASSSSTSGRLLWLDTLPSENNNKLVKYFEESFSCQKCGFRGTHRKRTMNFWLHAWGMFLTMGLWTPILIIDGTRSLLWEWECDRCAVQENRAKRLPAPPAPTSVARSKKEIRKIREG